MERVFLPQPHRYLKRDQTCHQTRCQICPMPDEKIGWITVCALPRLCDGNGSRINHHQPQTQQEYGGPDQGLIKMGQVSRVADIVLVDHQLVALGTLAGFPASTCFTAATNASARWA